VAVVPAPTISKVISLSSAIDTFADVNVVGVAAVTLVFSVASIDSLFAPSILVPFDLISTVTNPEDDAAATDALGICVIDIGHGALNLVFAVPAVNGVISSDNAIVNTVELGPVAPMAPIGPIGPSIPVAPSGPSIPVAPIGPSIPVAPIGPIGPTTPELASSTQLYAVPSLI